MSSTDTINKEECINKAKDVNLKDETNSQTEHTASTTRSDDTNIKDETNSQTEHTDSTMRSNGTSTEDGTKSQSEHTGSTTRPDDVNLKDETDSQSEHTGSTTRPDDVNLKDETDSQSEHTASPARTDDTNIKDETDSQTEHTGSTMRSNDTNIKDETSSQTEHTGSTTRPDDTNIKDETSSQTEHTGSSTTPHSNNNEETENMTTNKHANNNHETQQDGTTLPVVDTKFEQFQARLSTCGDDVKAGKHYGRLVPQYPEAPAGAYFFNYIQRFYPGLLMRCAAQSGVLYIPIADSLPSEHISEEVAERHMFYYNSPGAFMELTNSYGDVMYDYATEFVCVFPATQSTVKSISSDPTDVSRSSSIQSPAPNVPIQEHIPSRQQASPIYDSIKRKQVILSQLPSAQSDKNVILATVLGTGQYNLSLPDRKVARIELRLISRSFTSNIIGDPSSGEHLHRIAAFWSSHSDTDSIYLALRRVADAIRDNIGDLPINNLDPPLRQELVRKCVQATEGFMECKSVKRGQKAKLGVKMKPDDTARTNNRLNGTTQRGNSFQRFLTKIGLRKPENQKSVAESYQRRMQSVQHKYWLSSYSLVMERLYNFILERINEDSRDDVDLVHQYAIASPRKTAFDFHLVKTDQEIDLSPTLPLFDAIEQAKFPLAKIRCLLDIRASAFACFVAHREQMGERSQRGFGSEDFINLYSYVYYQRQKSCPTDRLLVHLRYLSKFHVFSPSIMDSISEKVLLDWFQALCAVACPMGI